MPTSKNPNYSARGSASGGGGGEVVKIPSTVSTHTSHLIPSHSWPSHPTPQAYHSEISKPSSVLCTGSSPCVKYLHSSLIPHPVLGPGTYSLPQAESISPSFVLPCLTSLRPLNTLHTAITIYASISPTKLRAACKHIPHLIPI